MWSAVLITVTVECLPQLSVDEARVDTDVDDMSSTSPATSTSQPTHAIRKSAAPTGQHPNAADVQKSDMGQCTHLESYHSCLACWPQKTCLEKKPFLLKKQVL